MASRQLRKLRKQQELLSSQNEAPDTKEESSEEEEVVAKPRPSMFSFAALGDMGDGNDDDDDDDEEEAEEPEPPKPIEKEVTSPQAEPAKKKSKKKKKKKGKQSAEAAAPEPPKEKEDEIEKALKELNIKSKKQRQAASSSAASTSKQNPDDQLNDLLKIDYRHLKAANEMRRLFGKAMDLAQVEEHQDNRQRTLPENIDLETYLSATAADPRRSRQPAKAGMFETLLRTNPFIEGKKSWPRGAAQGLTMKRISEGTPDVVEFTFAHEKAYDDLEGTFFQLVQMGDPMQIIHFLHRNPYHVSSLIQGSKVARQDQNSALAADLVERALFTFGRVTLSDFRRKLEQGKARINFARPENRQFYLAGYNLIQKLILKGTYRTALEWAKLFLSLNHDDPYALLNWVPVLALRSREAEWFIKFCDAITSKSPKAVHYAVHTLPLAHLQLDDYDTAHEILVKNMETMPWLYCALFSALCLDTPQSIWGNTARTDDDTLHTELYLHISKDLWNNPNAIALLKSAAENARKIPLMELNLLPMSPLPSLPVARWIYLDNTPALMSLVPREMLHNASPNFEFDPLPPAQKDNIFSSAVQRLPWSPDPSVGRGPFGAHIDPRREAGMRAAAERLLADMPPEELDRLMEADDVGGGGLMGLWNALMGRIMPRGGGDGGAGDGAQEQTNRGPFQATVEDGEDDDDDFDDDDDEFGEFGPNWDGRTPGHDLVRDRGGFEEEDDEDDEDEWTDPEEFDGEGLGEGPSISEVLEYMRMRAGYPMPGAWVPDEDSESDDLPELENPDEDEMPALEDPEEADRNRSQGTTQPRPS